MVLWSDIFRYSVDSFNNFQYVKDAESQLELMVQGNTIIQSINSDTHGLLISLARRVPRADVYLANMLAYYAGQSPIAKERYKKQIRWLSRKNDKKQKSMLTRAPTDCLNYIGYVMDVAREEGLIQKWRIPGFKTDILPENIFAGIPVHLQDANSFLATENENYEMNSTLMLDAVLMGNGFVVPRQDTFVCEQNPGFHLLIAKAFQAFEDDHIIDKILYKVRDTYVYYSSKQTPLTTHKLRANANLLMGTEVSSMLIGYYMRVFWQGELTQDRTTRYVDFIDHIIYRYAKHIDAPIGEKNPEYFSLAYDILNLILS